MSFCSCCLFLCVNSFLHQPSWRPWTKSLWFSAVWGYNRAKTECATPPKLATENWVIPSASWPVLDDRLGGEAAALQSACQIQTWLWLFLLSTIQSCGVKLGNMWPILYGLVLFYPPLLFFSLIFRSQGDSVFQAEARSLLSTCSIAADM